MKFSIDKNEQYTVFSLLEENLNSIMAPLLKSEFIIARNEGIGNFILDVSNVKFIDSSGLSSILTANRLWKGFGSFVITGIDHPSVKKLIEISRLDSVLEIIPTIQESIDFVMMEELERELKAEASTDDNMQ
ncbi:MAG: STAS domain-containing protein [Saprospiraceae bacterium]